MKMIRLTNGGFAEVDDQDFDWLSKRSWYKLKNYAATTTQPIIFMHDLINPPHSGLENDHQDGYGLNNQRSNLILMTRAHNHLKAKKQSNNTSGFKGVSFNQKNRKWIASIRLNTKLKYLGSFSTAELAGEAYIKANKEALGIV